MSISDARRASFQVLLRTARDKAYATEVLHGAAHASLDARDRRLTTELVFGVLRNQTLLDWYLSRFSKIAFERLDVEVKVALRLGAYQLLLLTRAPQHAAINESVELVKLSRIQSAKGFVNAVLRKIDRADFLRRLDGLSREDTYDLSVRFSHPEWLIERWRNRYELETVIQLLQQNNQPPRVFFRLNDPNLSGDLLSQGLADSQISWTTNPLCADILEVTSGDLWKTALFRERKILIQDAGSQIVPYLLNVEKGDICLDVCAAPGGKSSQIAWMTEGQATIVAMDIHWHRVRTMRALHGDRWSNLWFLVADGTTSLPYSILFDKVLVDAPCSGSATLGRHPEIRWKLMPDDLLALGQLQRALLEKTSNSVKPGGLLMYSTCSLESEENEHIIAAFLERNPHFRLELPANERFARFFDSQGHFRLLPSPLNSDGFFGALLRKSQNGR